MTEDEFIEYWRCLEKLRTLGLKKTELDRMVLNCHVCHFRGRCNVMSENMFVGAKTC
jgi:hypothetical protein